MSNLKHTYDIQIKINERKRRFNLKDENIIIVDYCLGCQKNLKFIEMKFKILVL